MIQASVADLLEFGSRRSTSLPFGRFRIRNPELDLSASSNQQPHKARKGEPLICKERKSPIFKVLEVRKSRHVEI